MKGKIGLWLVLVGNGQSMMRLQDNHRIYRTLFFAGTTKGEKGLLAVDETLRSQHINKGAEAEEEGFLNPHLALKQKRAAAGKCRSNG